MHSQESLDGRMQACSRGQQIESRQIQETHSDFCRRRWTSRFNIISLSFSLFPLSLLQYIKLSGISGPSPSRVRAPGSWVGWFHRCCCSSVWAEAKIYRRMIFQRGRNCATWEAAKAWLLGIHSHSRHSSNKLKHVRLYAWVRKSFGQRMQILRCCTTRSSN